MVFTGAFRFCAVFGTSRFNGNKMATVGYRPFVLGSLSWEHRNTVGIQRWFLRYVDHGQGCAKGWKNNQDQSDGTTIQERVHTKSYPFKCIPDLIG